MKTSAIRSLLSLLILSLAALLALSWGVGCTPTTPGQESTTEQSPQEQSKEATPTESSPEVRLEPTTEPTQEPPPEPQVEPTAEPTSDAGPEMTPEVKPEPGPDGGDEPIADQSSPDAATTCSPLPNIQPTWEWARDTNKPLSTGFLVKQNGKVVFEAYEPKNAIKLIPSGGGANEIYGMYSQTKSLTGLSALLLVKQGKIKLDDKVSQYISEWVNDKDKKDITIRELLSLSSGIQTSVNSPTDQDAKRSIQSPFTGKKFAYGTEPFLVFSVLVERVTSLSNEAFLQKHLFGPLGAKVTIKKTVDGFSSMAQGGQTTLRDIIKIGEELLLASQGKGQIFDANDIQTLMTPGLNPSYGLSVWLNKTGLTPDGASFKAAWPACGDKGLFSFLGAGGQVLTMIMAKRLIFSKSARLGAVSAQSSEGLWAMLFKGAQCTCQSP